MRKIFHFIIFGILGLIIEIFWTGIGSMLQGNWSLTGHTYLWMFFIYGLAIYLEPVHSKIREYHVLIRGFIWVFFIYFIEFTTGFLLDTFVGACPWDYSNATDYTLFGYIRLDYFPAWFTAGLLFEKVHDYLDRIKIILT